MARVYSEPWQIQQVYLLNVIRAATAPGGALAGYTVEEVVPPESAVTPIVGVQFRSASEKPTAQNRVRQTANFELVIVIERDFDPSQTDAARETKLATENAWNDQSGKGLGPVLRADPTLGGTAIISIVTHAISIGRGILDENQTSAVVNVMMTTEADSDYF